MKLFCIVFGVVSVTTRLWAAADAFTSLSSSASSASILSFQLLNVAENKKSSRTTKNTPSSTRLQETKNNNIHNNIDDHGDANPSSQANGDKVLTTTDTGTGTNMTTAIARFLKSDTIKKALSVFLGSYFTFVLNNDLSFGPIKASSMIGLLASMIVSEQLAIAAFCGSFAGMARHTVIPGTYPSSIILCILCAIIMTIFDKQQWLIGYGGRLGFIAQLACTLQYIGSSQFILSSSTTTTTAKLVGRYPSIVKLITQAIPTCIFTIMGALLMSAWKEWFAAQATKRRPSSSSSTDKDKEGNDKSSPSSSSTSTTTATTTMIMMHCRHHVLKSMSTSVAAASATGLLTSLFFPVSLAGPAFCGSFIAMSSPLRLETYGDLVGASFMGGIVQLFLSGVMLGGWGGKLGTASLFGVLSYKRILDATIGSSTNKTPMSTKNTNLEY